MGNSFYLFLYCKLIIIIAKTNMSFLWAFFNASKYLLCGQWPFDLPRQVGSSRKIEGPLLAIQVPKFLQCNQSHLELMLSPLAPQWFVVRCSKKIRPSWSDLIWVANWLQGQIQEFFIGGGGGKLWFRKDCWIFLWPAEKAETTTCFSICERQSPLVREILLCEQRWADHGRVPKNNYIFEYPWNLV